jgi:hypothetical protein
VRIFCRHYTKSSESGFANAIIGWLSQPTTAH